ncbi:hypothetical protein FZEAL_2319 [Fusarium zealandicum]|uniref:Zn(2)-C6 fungal-type domain-containing protein n=1 Tax=Fusarium zealandicum TaxID=1053134 RepID=A0A8H4URK2_9HYPO|nr:hypothetical protein FZEAL_2319 [Fusarium zealandicum]
MTSVNSPGDDVLLMPFSCFDCRNRKLKCDRLKPQCTRCSQSGDKCQYPATRKRPVITATRPRVKELESRLADLETRLKTAQEEGYQSFGPFEASGSDLIETGRFEQLPPQDVIEELTNIYFTNMYTETQLLHPSRYLASLYLPSHMQPPMCLQYMVLALAATASPPHKQLSQPFYRRARQYLEADELKGDGEYFVTLGHAQCCVLMTRFEVQNLWFSRSSMSTSKAVRLAQILGLHQLDGNSGMSPTLPPPRDWCEQEERRRTLWAVFCADKNTSSTTGWPTLMDAQRISTLLPASEEAFQLGIEEPSTKLTQVLSGNKSEYSSYACRILATHLFHESLDHTYQDRPDQNPTDVENSTFWRRHNDLNNGLAAAFLILPDSLRPSPGAFNREATTINLLLHTATICLHRIGAAQAKKHNIPVDVLAGTQARLFPAADAIFGIVASVADVSAMFRNPMVAFATYMAAYVFLEDYASAQTSESEMKMNALMDLMVAIGQENEATASVALQMAHELRRTGVDPSALSKVQGLIDKMALKGPLMARQDNSAGSVVFCPFEMPGPAPEGVPREYPRNY